MPQTNKILIANRGEIACRVIRTARDMGYRTVAVYSDADAHALHVRLADEAVPIGPGPAADSYLSIANVIKACQLTGADAVHPGYGFLSENADFARACAAAGLTFVGPPAAAIELMGSKRLSKIAMEQAGVPCIPGYQGSDQSDDRLIAEAARIGYPLMVKASAGGGGRGMRRVDGADDLPAALIAARSEAQSAFGSSELILERALIQPRHIELQIFADAHGNVVHLGERDCSVQRRHQKVVEEAPSPVVDPTLRAAMGAAAIEAARACDYRGAGTVEFLVDSACNFYFLEMNTRLQVEHPVTEMVTGLDLVEWQLRVAAGDPLPMSQQDIPLTGCAIEVRLYAEDPQHDFLPQTGQVLAWEPPKGPGLRVDHGVQTGQVISPHYDPMLAKIIAHGPDRPEALRKLQHALAGTVLLGVKTNAAFLAAVLRHPVFAAGEATTGFLTDHFASDATLYPAPPTLRMQALAAGLIHARGAAGTSPQPDLQNWRSTGHSAWPYRLMYDGALLELSLLVEGTCPRMRCTAQAGSAQEVVEILDIAEGHCAYLADGVRRRLRFVFDGPTLCLDGPFGHVAFQNATHLPAQDADVPGNGRVMAPMDGAILSVTVAAGDTVTKGQTIAVLEAMKMEHRLTADTSGTVSQVLISPGAQVKIRQLLAVIEAKQPAE